MATYRTTFKPAQCHAEGCRFATLPEPAEFASGHIAWHTYERHPDAWLQLVGDREPTTPKPPAWADMWILRRPEPPASEDILDFARARATETWTGPQAESMADLAFLHTPSTTGRRREGVEWRPGIPPGELYIQVCEECGHVEDGVEWYGVWPCKTLRLFVAFWREHPAWRQEWDPELAEFIGDSHTGESTP